MKSKSILIFPVALALAATTASAAVIAPNDPSVNANLRIWLTDAENNYNATTGVWADSSANGIDAVASTKSNISDHPTLSLSTTTADTNTSAVRFNPTADEVLHTTNLNGGTGYSQLTMFTVYWIESLGTAGNTNQRLDRTRPAGIGSVSFEQNGGTSVGTFSSNINIASDPSIRFDNGRIGGPSNNSYSVGSLPQSGGNFIPIVRITRFGTGGVFDEWVGGPGTPTPNQILDSSNVTVNGTLLSGSTRDDDLYLGDIRNINNTPTMEVSQVVLYDTALTDGQIEGIYQSIVGIPEPSTSLLMSGAIVGLLSLRRRQSA